MSEPSAAFVEESYTLVENPEKRISELRQDRCPLCGGPNDCGMVAGKNECWCEKVAMSRDVLERMPDEAKRVCVVRSAAWRRQPSEFEAMITEGRHRVLDAVKGAGCLCLKT